MKKMNFFAVLANLLVCKFAFAGFDITPVIATVTPSGNKATISYTAENSTDQKVPIQISVFHRVPDENGKEKYGKEEDASDLFQIVPSQIILNPKEKRTIRLTYIGDPKIKQEMSFRVVSEEFPISISDPSKVKDKTVASIAILSRYVSSLYVKPAGVSPALTAEASPVNENKEIKMNFVVNNTGTEHKMLADVKFKLVNIKDKKEYPLPEDTVKQIGNQNILAGKSRKFVVTWPKDVPQTKLRVVIEPVAK